MKIKLKFWLITFSSLAVFMLLNIGIGQTDAERLSETHPMITEFCFDGKVNDWSVDRIVRKYHKSTNDFFNANIERIMKDIDEGLQAPPTLDQFENSPHQDLCKDKEDYICRTLVVCKDNSSPYCVGVNSLGFIPDKYEAYNTNVLEKKDYDYLKYSYFCYHAALEVKKNEVLEDSSFRVLDQCGDPDFSKNALCRKQAECQSSGDPSCEIELRELRNRYDNKRGVFGLASSVAQKADFIDEELGRSKEALDVTLDTYAQLQTAWKMHIKYIDIYQSLVKYRDHLAKIRRQAELFPARFIDASTTACK